MVVSSYRVSLRVGIVVIVYRVSATVVIAMIVTVSFKIRFLYKLGADDGDRQC